MKTTPEEDIQKPIDYNRLFEEYAISKRTGILVSSFLRNWESNKIRIRCLSDVPIRV